MKPELSDYKILYMHQTYFVLDPYNLMMMPCVSIVGWGHRKIEDAESYKDALFRHHTNEYERLKKLGRSFPDNN